MTLALFYADKNQFRRDKHAGSFLIQPHNDNTGEISFWYTCPCGCGAQAPLLAGKRFKPGHSPSWNWNGSLDRPTLMPSVNHVNHWHGWLKEGVWTVA